MPGLFALISARHAELFQHLTGQVCYFHFVDLARGFLK